MIHEFSFPGPSAESMKRARPPSSEIIRTSSLQGGCDAAASFCFREMARVKQTKVISDVQELRFSEDQRTVLRFI